MSEELVVIERVFVRLDREKGSRLRTRMARLCCPTYDVPLTKPREDGPMATSRTTARLPAAAGLALALIMTMSARANAQEETAAADTAVIDGLMWAIRGNGEDITW